MPVLLKPRSTAISNEWQNTGKTEDNCNCGSTNLQIMPMITVNLVISPRYLWKFVNSCVAAKQSRRESVYRDHTWAGLRRSAVCGCHRQRTWPIHLYSNEQRRHNNSNCWAQCSRYTSANCCSKWSNCQSINQSLYLSDVKLITTQVQ